MGDTTLELIRDYIKDNLKIVDGELYWVNSGPTNRRKLDIPAGFLMNSGYRYIKLKQRRVPYHHVIWFIHYNYFPSKLDHVDRNPLNNRIENLRLVSDKQNCQNRSKTKGKSSKYLGVTFHKTSGKFLARIKQKSLGYFNTEKEAGVAYAKASRVLYGDYAGEVYE
jgi:hypothetical protein